MSSINPKTSFPAAQLVSAGASVLTNTATSVAIGLPVTASGQRASYVRVAAFSLSQAAASAPAAVHVRLAPTASTATATTGDTICYGTESLWLNTLGMNAIGALGIVGNIRIQVSAIEEGAIGPTMQQSGMG